MSSFLSDLGFAFRIARRSAGLSAAAIATMALGVGAATAIFCVVRGAILEPWPYAAADRIVTLRRSFPRLQQPRLAPFSVPEILEVRARTDVFERSLAGDARNVNLSDGGRPERVHGGAITASAFEMLGVAPELGRVFTPSEDVPGGPRVVVLSHRLWKSRYAADPGIVGKTIRIEGQSYTVLGVMPPRFVFWNALLYFPLGLDSSSADRRDRRLVIQGRLVPGLTPEKAAAALDSIARRWEREQRIEAPEYEGSHFIVESLKREVLRTIRPALIALAAAAVLALLAGAVNIANLLLARAASRGREIAVRIALGSGRGRILRLFLLEGLVLALPGGALGLAAAAVSVPWLLSLIPYGYIPAEADVRVDAATIGCAALLAAACGLLFGLAPLLRARGARSHRSLQESSSRLAGDRRGRAARGFFVATQVAVALAVVSASGLLVQSMRRLLDVPVGFTAEKVETVRFALPTDGGPDRARAFVGETLRRIAAIRGVEASGAVTDLPLTEAPSRTLEIEGLAGESGGIVFEADELAASPGHFAALRIPIESGRDFSTSDAAEEPLVAVVNRSFARRFFPGNDPIRHRVRLGREAPGTWRTIVGVAGDVRQHAIEREPRPAVYIPLLQADPVPRTVALAVRSALPAGDVQARVREAIWSLDRDMPVYEAAPMTKIVSDSLGGRRLAAVLLVVLAAVAIGLTALGAAALARYAVVERRREVAVRVALGAGSRDVTRLFLRETAARILAGIAAGAAVSLAAARLLSALLFEVSAVNPATLAAAAFLLSAITLGATWIPARRAGRAAPMTALRSD